MQTLTDSLIGITRTWLFGDTKRSFGDRITAGTWCRVAVAGPVAQRALSLWSCLWFSANCQSWQNMHKANRYLVLKVMSFISVSIVNEMYIVCDYISLNSGWQSSELNCLWLRTWHDWDWERERGGEAEFVNPALHESRNYHQQIKYERLKNTAIFPFLFW